MLVEVASLLAARAPPQGLELFCDHCITLSLFKGLETLLETENFSLERFRRLLPLAERTSLSLWEVYKLFSVILLLKFTVYFVDKGLYYIFLLIMSPAIIFELILCQLLPTPWFPILEREDSQYPLCRWRSSFAWWEGRRWKWEWASSHWASLPLWPGSSCVCRPAAGSR